MEKPPFIKFISESLKSPMRKQFEEDLERLPQLIADAKKEYKEKLKSMTEKELLQEICYLLKFH